jgi:hypothetical protein
MKLGRWKLTQKDENWWRTFVKKKESADKIVWLAKQKGFRAKAQKIPGGSYLVEVWK